jgi:two-component system KDP operon response regulator KdpE
LDLSLPQKDGFDFIGHFREYSSAPIIILSARSDEASKVKALNLGADDFVDKPFSVLELLARLQANLRRYSNRATTTIISCGDVEINLASHCVSVRGNELKCTPKEFELLKLFVKNAGKTLTHQWLLKEVWGVGYQNEMQYLRVFIKQLRQKMEIEPNRPKIIITQTGIGYQMKDVCEAQ